MTYQGPGGPPSPGDEPGQGQPPNYGQHPAELRASRQRRQLRPAAAAVTVSRPPRRPTSRRRRRPTASPATSNPATNSPASTAPRPVTAPPPPPSGGGNRTALIISIAALVIVAAWWSSSTSPRRTRRRPPQPQRARHTRLSPPACRRRCSPAAHRPRDSRAARRRCRAVPGSAITEDVAKAVVTQYVAAINQQDETTAAALICSEALAKWHTAIHASGGDFTVKVTGATFKSSTPASNGIDVAYALDVQSLSSSQTGTSNVTFTVVDENGPKICGEK